ncbi:MAG: hypothetical protein HKN16_12925 [Saprospiraceae bacterium]|nr:hypothetical protein [Saprospiraceae bacterium]
MQARIASISGLVLISLSQVLFAFGFGFLMAQRPIDFAHWALLLGATLLFSLWFSLPDSVTKKWGLLIMTLGIVGVAGMCTIDFLLWSMSEDPTARDMLFQKIGENPSIQIPFLMLGPAFFYSGICISTYGLFNRYKWQVLLLNLGALLIGLGLMVLRNGSLAGIGGIFLLIGLGSILLKDEEKTIST